MIFMVTKKKKRKKKRFSLEKYRRSRVLLEARQQDYYSQRCDTLLHSYCTGTYTAGTVLLL